MGKTEHRHGVFVNFQDEDDEDRYDWDEIYAELGVLSAEYESTWTYTPELLEKFKACNAKYKTNNVLNNYKNTRHGYFYSFDVDDNLTQHIKQEYCHRIYCNTFENGKVNVLTAFKDEVPQTTRPGETQLLNETPYEFVPYVPPTKEEIEKELNA